MKQIFTLLAVATLAMCTLTSCNRDAEEARTLNGQWSGYIRTYYYDRWGLTGDDYRTTIQFNQRNNYGGIGFEVDYDLNDPWGSYYYSPIRWEVRNGVICIDYEDGAYVEISRYTLNNDIFRGYMYDGTRRDIEFSLVYDGNVNWSRWSYSGRSWRAAEAGSDAETAGDAEEDIYVNGACVARGAFARSLKAKAATD